VIEGNLTRGRGTTATIQIGVNLTPVAVRVSVARGRAPRLGSWVVDDLGARRLQVIYVESDL
jgi:hypothetical protein